MKEKNREKARLDFIKEVEVVMIEKKIGALEEKVRKTVKEMEKFKENVEKLDFMNEEEKKEFEESIKNGKYNEKEKELFSFYEKIKKDIEKYEQKIKSCDGIGNIFFTLLIFSFLLFGSILAFFYYITKEKGIDFNEFLLKWVQDWKNFNLSETIHKFYGYVEQHFIFNNDLLQKGVNKISNLVGISNEIIVFSMFFLVITFIGIIVYYFIEKIVTSINCSRIKKVGIAIEKNIRELGNEIKNLLDSPQKDTILQSLNQVNYFLETVFIFKKLQENKKEIAKRMIEDGKLRKNIIRQIENNTENLFSDLKKVLKEFVESISNVGENSRDIFLKLVYIFEVLNLNILKNSIQNRFENKSIESKLEREDDGNKIER